MWYSTDWWIMVTIYASIVDGLAYCKHTIVSNFSRSTQLFSAKRISVNTAHLWKLKRNLSNQMHKTSFKVEVKKKRRRRNHFMSNLNVGNLYLKKRKKKKWNPGKSVFSCSVHILYSMWNSEKSNDFILHNSGLFAPISIFFERQTI